MTSLVRLGRKNLSTPVNRRIAPYRDQNDGNRLKAGWEKDIFWQVYDQLGHPLTYRLPISDTINNNANNCRAPLQGKGTLLTEGKGTDGNGLWKHIYTVFSPSCLRGGNCGISGYQEYTVNGFRLSNDRKSFVYSCNGISLSGDGSTPPTVPGPSPKTTEGMVDSFWVGTLETIADDSSYQYWTNILNTAQAQGSSELLIQSRALGRSLFQSSAYAALNRSDADFVRDLYYAYLQRDPDADGYAFWLATLQSDNANGLNGREHLLQGFEGSTEFMNLVSSLVATAALEDACDPIDQQYCANTGGSWDPDSCTCTPVCNSYDEQMCYYYGGWWDSTSCRCYY
ncbi:MAG TPA: DUF4214 domain-containing protein [Pyrinomonadaceae bacterium]|nr:DUF4214 domain-containing protein [Pyrinomonadaceae bacterium]